MKKQLDGFKEEWNLVHVHLGGRSILGDPRSEKMQKNLNLKVKYRESFRPFAPSILKEDLSEWFDINVDSPYMLMVANINKDKTLK